MWLVLTVAVSAVGGVLLLKLRVPGGMLVGAIVAVAALNLATQQAYIPQETRILAQVLTGTYIGCMVTREDMRQMPKLIGPYLVVMVSFLVLNLCMAAMMFFITDFDLITCLFSTAPGGVSDMPIISMDLGADSSVVAVMQFIRMIFGMGCLPSIIMLSDRLLEPENARVMEERAQQLHVGHAKHQHVSLVSFLPIFAAALAAGILGHISGIPAGTMAAALIVTAALKISGVAKGMPMWLRRVAQVISGCCIGAGVTRAQVLQMRQLVLPALLLCLAYILCCVGMGMVISKVFHMEPREAMLTLSPAGATEMALIAADLGVESASLVVLQVCRLVGVTLFFPQIFSLIVTLLQ